MKPQHLVTIVAILIGLVAPGAAPAAAPALAQAPAPSPSMAPATAPVDASTQAKVIEKLAQTITEKYVDAVKAKEIAAHVRASLGSGVYASASNAAAFAEAVTADLQSLQIDRHLRVGYDPRIYAMVSDTSAQPQGIPDAEIKRRARENFGFQKVEILMGNVGYLDLRAFVSPSIAGPAAVGAMNFLASCEALIIDLRNNGGGTPEMIQLLTSYLYDGDGQHINDFYNREGESTTQFWTLPYVPGPHIASVPVYLLTSRRTFSCAEEFAYDLQNLKRATIVGETTGGGAHPGGFFPLADGFVAFVSTGKAVNPVSHTNWEGVGVKPDIDVPMEDALRRAHTEALKAIAAKEEDPERKTELAWSVEALESEANPIALTPADLRAYAGSYGIRKVFVDGDGLYFQREQQPRIRLIPVGKDLFRGEFMDDFRFRFGRDAGGRVVELTGVTPSGPRFTEKRGK
jgi:retinol-binding protein 3